MVLAFALRVTLAAALPEAADTHNYRRVAETLLAGGQLYVDSPDIYPYPPPWSFAEVGALRLSRASGLPFVFLIKLLPILGDAGLCAALYRIAMRSGADPVAARGPALAYALNPIAVLVSSVHGQFDSLALLFVALAILWLPAAGVGARSSLALGLAVALKSFPVLLVPVVAARARRTWSATAYLVAALLPTTILLAPYLGHHASSVLHELAGYSGVPDQGSGAIYRLVIPAIINPTAEPAFRAALFGAAKVTFLLVFAGLSLRLWTQGRRGGWSVPRAICWVLASFYAIYPGLSSQYLLWMVPFLILTRGKLIGIYSLFGAIAMVAFYSAVHPAMLGVPALPSGLGHALLAIWAAATLCWWYLVVRWLGSELRNALASG